MGRTIDLRGLSCPLPALRAGEAVKGCPADEREITVLVDCGAAEANVERAMARLGWKVEGNASAGGGAGVSLTLRRGR